MSTPPQIPTAARLQAIIKAEKDKRSQNCLDELTAVLKKHGCTWDAQLYFVRGQWQGRIEIVALDVVEVTPAKTAAPDYPGTTA